jgi:hypothetical protein
VMKSGKDPAVDPEVGMPHVRGFDRTLEAQGNAAKII